MNPRVDRNMPVVVQGITGRTGRMHAQLMRAYGTNIVAGTSPNPAAAEIDGIPVFRNCVDAVAATGATASVAFVGAGQLLEAVREALAAGIRLIVSPTEGAPVHDMLRALAEVRAAGALWIGPSTPGMAVTGQVKLGFLPDASLLPGPLGLMSKSGTLSYEAGYRLARRGVGTSVWVGVGGDPVKGSRFADLVPFYAQDRETRALLVLGEIGGHEEEDFARALTAARFAKPVFALIAGATAREGVTMGHAGALTHGSHGTYAAKRAALAAAGAQVYASLGEMVEGVCAALR